MRLAGVSPSKCCTKLAQAARGWGIEVLDYATALQGLLDECAAVVSHGGMGLSSMALKAGKPLLLLPQNVEQGILAHRLLKQGLAQATVRLRDREKVQSRVDELLATGRDRTKLGAFAARYALYSPSTAVAKAVQAVSALL